jgi:XTP/dITP diphosphohydrolase
VNGTVQQVVVATGNQHKVDEITSILMLERPIVLVAMSAFGLGSPVEDGESFEANALIKARACVAATGLPAIADDSGIEVEALDGAPGIHSARFAGEPTDDAANNRLLLQRLSDLGATEPAQRRAAFVCAAALVLPDGREHTTVARLRGHVLTAPSGTGGFGYDALFVPDAVSDGRSAAELDPSEKDAISHRGLAFRALRPLLLESLG